MEGENYGAEGKNIFHVFVAPATQISIFNNTAHSGGATFKTK
jgi:hypothetical protein